MDKTALYGPYTDGKQIDPRTLDTLFDLLSPQFLVEVRCKIEAHDGPVPKALMETMTGYITNQGDHRRYNAYHRALEKGN